MTAVLVAQVLAREDAERFARAALSQAGADEAVIALREPRFRACLCMRREGEAYACEEIAGDRVGGALKWLESSYALVMRDADLERVPGDELARFAMRGEKCAGLPAGAERGALRRVIRAFSGIDRAVLGAAWYGVPITALARAADARLGPDLVACLCARETEWTLLEAPAIARRSIAARVAGALRVLECGLLTPLAPRWARALFLLVLVVAGAGMLGVAGRRVVAASRAIAAGSFLEPFADVPELELKRLLPRVGSVAFVADEKGLGGREYDRRLQNRLLPLGVCIGDAELRAGRVTHVVMKFGDAEAEARFCREHDIAISGRCRNGFAVGVRRPGRTEPRAAGTGT